MSTLFSSSDGDPSATQASGQSASPAYPFLVGGTPVWPCDSAELLRTGTPRDLFEYQVVVLWRQAFIPHQPKLEQAMEIALGIDEHIIQDMRENHRKWIPFVLICDEKDAERKHYLLLGVDLEQPGVNTTTHYEALSIQSLFPHLVAPAEGFRQMGVFSKMESPYEGPLYSYQARVEVTLA